jgi:hypothetical protein
MHKISRTGRAARWRGHRRRGVFDCRRIGGAFGGCAVRRGVGGASAAPSAEATVDEVAARADPFVGQDRISTDPNQAFSFLNVDTGKYEGFDISTAEECCQAPVAKLLGKDIAIDWQTPWLGHHHGWEPGRPLGHLDRFDERDRRSRQGGRLRRSLLLRLGRRRGPEGLAGPVAV